MVHLPYTCMSFLPYNENYMYLHAFLSDHIHLYVFLRLWLGIEPRFSHRTCFVCHIPVFRKVRQIFLSNHIHLKAYFLIWLRLQPRLLHHLCCLRHFFFPISNPFLWKFTCPLIQFKWNIHKHKHNHLFFFFSLYLIFPKCNSWLLHRKIKFGFFKVQRKEKHFLGIFGDFPGFYF